MTRRFCPDPECETELRAHPYQRANGTQTAHFLCPRCDDSPSDMTPANVKTTPKV